MILNPATPLHHLDGDVLLRLALAAVIGIALGIDRELKNSPAGLRTHGLVCFTSALMTVAVIALYNQFGGEETNMDPLRIIEGAGAFMGIAAAGLIIVSKGEVRNLTTAVHLWLAAVIGIACGAGQYPLVATGALVAVVMITLLGIFEARWFGRQKDKDEERAG
jgi:putative Mg2+ transporter-C (MgtC) family protein